MNIVKLITMSVGAAAMVSTSAMAAPSAWLDVGTHGYTIRATNQGDTRYLCSYVVQVTFANGAIANFAGQTAPPTGGTHSNVSEHNTGRPVSHATLTGWSCRVN